MPFDLLVETYRPRVFRYALAFLRDRDAAETVTQDCFLRAHRALSTFRGECAMQTWLLRIAVNLVRDHARNRKLQFWKRSAPRDNRALEQFVEPGAHGQSPERLAMLRQQVSAIWRCAGKLPTQQKAVFLLRFVEDLDILQIAEITGLQEGTVKSHLFRALRAVRGEIGRADA